MKFRFVLLVLLLSWQLQAQEFGGNPPSLKWKQVDNHVARVIFPAGLDTIAGVVATIVKHLDQNSYFSLGERRRKINIVLQNQTTVSNAYVALGPFRSEFYLTPDQNSFELGSLPWPVQLAIHEYRHVQQNNNFNVGLSRVFHFIFGEQGQALANSLVIPDWFYEGDAVFNETLVSSQVRGRLPFFYNGYRSLWLEGKDYSWMKVRNGSYLDYTPDHYPLGYQLVAYGSEKYGDAFWKDVTHDAASYRGILYPLQQAIKRYSGKSFKDFRSEALDYFKLQFDASVPAPIKQKKHFIANEEYPFLIKDSAVLFMTSSYKQIPAFVVRSEDGLKKNTHEGRIPG